MHGYIIAQINEIVCPPKSYMRYCRMSNSPDNNNCFELCKQDIVSERIKEQRLKKRISQEKLAGLVDVKRATVNSWETHKTTPSSQNLDKVARVLGCDVGYLRGEYDKETPEITDVFYKVGLSREAYENLKDDENIQSIIDELLSNDGFIRTISYLYMILQWAQAFSSGTTMEAVEQLKIHHNNWANIIDDSLNYLKIYILNALCTLSDKDNMRAVPELTRNRLLKDTFCLKNNKSVLEILNKNTR